jgi:hypothetical protein
MRLWKTVGIIATVGAILLVINNFSSNDVVFDSEGTYIKDLTYGYTSRNGYFEGIFLVFKLNSGETIITRQKINPHLRPGELVELHYYKGLIFHNPIYYGYN